MIAMLMSAGAAFVGRRVRHAVAHPLPAQPGHRPADPRRRTDRAPARGQGRHADDGRHRDRRRDGHRLSRSPTSAGSSVAFATPGWALLALIVGLGIVGWIDDYLGVRARRNLGLAQAGKDVRHRRDRRGVRVARGVASCTPTRTSRSPGRWTSTSARSGCSSGSSLVIYATANAVNLTDGLDGLAAGSSAFTFAAFMIIAFTEFRHPSIYGVLHAGQALDQAIVAAAMFGACAGFLWWNAAPAQDLHGRHRLARDRRRDGGPRAS